MAPWASPMNLLESQVLRPHLRPTRSELRVGTRNLYFNMTSRGFWCVLSLRSAAQQSPSLWENKNMWVFFPWSPGKLSRFPRWSSWDNSRPPSAPNWPFLRITSHRLNLLTLVPHWSQACSWHGGHTDPLQSNQPSHKGLSSVQGHLGWFRGIQRSLACSREPDAAHRGVLFGLHKP